MGFFTKEVLRLNPYNRKEYVRGRGLTVPGKVAFALGLMAVVYGIFGDSTMDLMGDSHHDRSQEEATEVAQTEYSEMFAAASPADKFTLQYGGTTVYRVDQRIGGNGTLGSFTEGSEDYKATFNNGCLANTAYDINGGDLSVEFSTGLFIRTRVAAEADIPTAAAFAEVDAGDPDMLRIVSGNDQSTDLVFTGVESDGPLVPVEGETQRILDTYGCQTGLQGEVALVNAVDLTAEELRTSL